MWRTPFFKVRKVGPDSHCVHLRELSKFQFLLNFKLLAPSWELVNCRTFCWFLFMLMQSTDIGCKGNLFSKKKWLEAMLLFQNFSINQALKRWCRKWQKTCKWLLNDLKRLQKPFFSWNILIMINIAWWDN